jgi:hypothetical protein
MIEASESEFEDSPASSVKSSIGPDVFVLEISFFEGIFVVFEEKKRVLRSSNSSRRNSRSSDGGHNTTINTS